ncbi:hypothetical protein GALL_492090 [mine drainage metagenome]|uniref:Uncharacterized protein n=1 Tax=mine drainage metagenome TaxID=410659 RepID=A0A1J5PN53_9ZZZZ
MVGNAIEDVTLILKTNRVRCLTSADETPFQTNFASMYEFWEKNILVFFFISHVVKEWCVDLVDLNFLTSLGKVDADG